MTEPPAQDDESPAREKQWAALTQPRIFDDDLDVALAALIRVGQATDLRRFYPFTSLTRLCFAAGDRPYDHVQPAFIAFDRQQRFAVHRGSPSPDAPSAVSLETSDPGEAMAELLRLLDPSQAS